MTVRNVEPQIMKLGVLTAALQERTPRGVRDPSAACMFALQNEALPAQGTPVQGRGREAWS